MSENLHLADGGYPLLVPVLVPLAEKAGAALAADASVEEAGPAHQPHPLPTAETTTDGFADAAQLEQKVPSLSVAGVV